MSRRHADRAVGTVEFGLAAWEQHRLGMRDDVVMKPVRRRVGSCDRDAVAVGEEFLEPGHMPALAAEWRDS